MTTTVRPAPPHQRARTRSIVLVVCALVALGLVRALLVDPLRIPTGSMTPTLVPGDHVLVEHVSPHVGDWHQGEVVLFRAPDGQLMVKRIVATAGQTVGLADGRLEVDGTRIREPWSDPQLIDSVYFGPVTVPAGHVFLLGDNRGNSRDSRTFGSVPVSALSGRVWAVAWPPSHLTWLG